MDDCSGIPNLAYGEFSEWLHKKVGSQRIPIAGSLEVTMRCNLRCVHCYIPEEQRATSEPELTLPEIKRILDEITDAGCLWFLLTGGEPFLRPDFLDIYTYAKKKGLITTIFTNGTLITSRIADYLAEWRPFKMEITLYGATQETYERVTGIPGSYSLCRRGIDMLLLRGIPLSLKTMVMSLNKHEVEGMKAIAKELGVTFRFDASLNPTINGSLRPVQYRLTPDEIVSLDISDPDRVAEWPKYYENLQIIPAENHSLYLCKAGVQGFHIDARGFLSLCMLARSTTYNLLQGSFRGAWQNFIPTIIGKKFSDNFGCDGCSLRLVCSQCPALAYLEFGDEEKQIDFICSLAKKRYQVFKSPGN